MKATRQASADSYLITFSLRNLSRVTEWGEGRIWGMGEGRENILKIHNIEIENPSLSQVIERERFAVSKIKVEFNKQWK